MNVTPIQINVNGQHKTIGMIRGNVAVFPRKRSIHFFRKYNGWAVSKDVVKRLLFKNVPFIGIKDTENNNKHVILTEDFAEHAQLLTEEETGEDKQLVVNLEYFKTKKGK